LFADRTPAIADLVGRFARLLDPAIRPPLRAGGIWLVRPDGYVACSTSDAQGVAHYLSEIVRAGMP